MFQIKLRVGTIFKVYLFIYCILNRRKNVKKISHLSCSPHVFADGTFSLTRPALLTFLLTAALIWGISVHAASRFCWQPSFGVYLSMLHHVFADSPVLGYICLCCVTFLLTACFWGISVHAASHFCWQPSFVVYLSVLRHAFADEAFLRPSI